MTRLIVPEIRKLGVLPRCWWHAFWRIGFGHEQDQRRDIVPYRRLSRFGSNASYLSAFAGRKLLAKGLNLVQAFQRQNNLDGIRATDGPASARQRFLFPRIP